MEGAESIGDLYGLEQKKCIDAINRVSIRGIVVII